VSLAPTHAWALADLAVCLLREWRVEEALKYARAAARLRPSEPQILEVLRTASRLASRPGHRAGLQHTEE
jgi:Flp pilus assembly protein TadD